jgi:FkbM family methyltransferase
MLLRKIRKTLRMLWDSLWNDSSAPVTKVGGRSAWAIRADLLKPDSIAISGGAGRDVTFEMELVTRYGCRVFLFDPSPTGMETMGLQGNQHERLKFLPLGLASSPGRIEFNLPENPAEGSYSLKRAELPTPATCFECTSVSAFMRELSLDGIDILKLDIEGFEYGVLDDVLASTIPVRQICVGTFKNQFEESFDIRSSLKT